MANAEKKQNQQQPKQSQPAQQGQGKKQQKTQQKGGNNKGRGPQLSPKQRHENWTQSKIERAGKDEYTVVSQKTRDVALFVNLANAHDNIMAYLRTNAGLTTRVSLEAFGKIIERSNQVKMLLDEVNAEAYKLAGRDYIRPRGIRDMLKESKAVKEEAAKPAEKKAAKQPASSEKPAAAATA